jgi:nucleoside-diphosphate-sugar epimerase
MTPVVLVTGATGFIGGAVLAKLLRWPRPMRVMALIRAADTAAAQLRIRRSLARFDEPDQPAYAWDRCQVLVGDLTEPATLDDPQLDETTHVVHLAANTSLRSVSGARAANILGTLGLAHRMRRVRGLVRFLHVGTAFICGANPSRVVSEADYPRLDVRHLVEYTRSKAEAELLLERTAPELPLVVARPSIVVGHSRLGCGPSASIFWYYRAVHRLRCLPTPVDRRKDIVPADYVADALLRLLLQPALRHTRYHVSAGESASVSWQEMVDVFARYDGPRDDDLFRIGDHATLCKERGRMRELFGQATRTAS